MLGSNEENELPILRTGKEVIVDGTFEVIIPYNPGESEDKYEKAVAMKHSLCLKSNAEMVPKIPSCHYMLLM